MTVLERSRKARYWRTTELIMKDLCNENTVLRGPSSTAPSTPLQNNFSKALSLNLRLDPGHDILRLISRNLKSI